MCIRKIFFILIMMLISLPILQSQESVNLGQLLDELESVIESQQRLLKEQENEIKDLLNLLTEQKQEQSGIRAELSASKKLQKEQKIEIENLKNCQIERQAYFQNYVKTSEETIEALKSGIEDAYKKLSTVRTIRDISLIGNLIQGIFNGITLLSP